MKKKLLAVVLALALLVGLTACGGPKTPEEVLAKAEENAQAIKSMSFDMTMEMEMSAAGQSVEFTIGMNGECTSDPNVMHGTMSIDMGTLGAMAMEMYVEEADGKAVTYAGMDAGSGVVWGKQEADIEEAGDTFDAKGSMNEYLTMASNMKENGTETVNGVEAARYDGVITRENMEEALEATGMMDSLSELAGITGEDALEGGLDDLPELADMPISIWVDKAKMLPVKYEMDMSELIASLMGSVEDVEVSINRAVVSMTIGDFDSVAAIEIPEEAKNAQSMG